MSDIFLFDVDGTLTVAKQKMVATFQKDFLEWMDDKEVYIVSGGTFERILNQVGTDVLNKTSGVFACMGNIFLQRADLVNESGYSEWQIVYENKFSIKKICLLVNYSITSIIPSVIYLAILVICFLISPSLIFHLLEISFTFLFSFTYSIILFARYTGNSC